MNSDAGGNAGMAGEQARTLFALLEAFLATSIVTGRKQILNHCTRYIFVLDSHISIAIKKYSII